MMSWPKKRTFNLFVFCSIFFEITRVQGEQYLKLFANKNKNFTHLYGGGGGYEGPVCKKKGRNNVMIFFLFFTLPRPSSSLVVSGTGKKTRTILAKNGKSGEA